ncbi:MAG: hypothetical protein V7739_17835, partial [Motiliproteus sp.]
MYRYSAKPYNDSLLKMGVLRIGTLHDFRRSEHKKGIADPQEGKKTVSHHIEEFRGSDGAEQPADLKSLTEFNIIGGDVKGAENAVFKNVLLRKKIDHPDCFIFCTSAFCFRSTMLQFEDADSCVLIKNQIGFFNSLSYALNSITPVIFRGV